MRDLDIRPYTQDEVRVGEFIQNLAPDLGYGDDPIGFLMASYTMLIHERKQQKQKALNQIPVTL